MLRHFNPVTDEWEDINPSEDRVDPTDAEVDDPRWQEDEEDAGPVLDEELDEEDG